MTITHPNKQLMHKAITLAIANAKKGGHAIGAIIVKNGKIISQGVNTVVSDENPTHHAEMNAITNATKKLKSRKLQGCYLYSTYEPCPMCASAAIWARCEGIVYGTSMKNTNEKYHQRILITSEKILSKGDPQLKLHKEFMKKECDRLLKL